MKCPYRPTLKGVWAWLKINTLIYSVYKNNLAYPGGQYSVSSPVSLKSQCLNIANFQNRFTHHGASRGQGVAQSNLDVEVLSRVEHLGQLGVSLADQGPLHVRADLPSGNNLA